MTHDDPVKGNTCFFCATGVTDGDVLAGVRYEPDRLPPRPLQAP